MVIKVNKDQENIKEDKINRGTKRTGKQRMEWDGRNRERKREGKGRKGRDRKGKLGGGRARKK